MLDKAFSQINTYKKALDIAWLNNKASANNIANVDTPGYKKEVVKFDSVLEDAVSNRLKKTHPNHVDINGDGPRIEKVRNTSFRHDDNNVDIDTENANIAKNQMKFNMVSTQLSSKLRRLKDAIDSGR